MTDPSSSHSSPNDASHLPGKHASNAHPSGSKSDDPSTAGSGKTDVKSSTPESNAGQVNPSPEDANATPGTLGQK